MRNIMFLGDTFHPSVADYLQYLLLTFDVWLHFDLDRSK